MLLLNSVILKSAMVREYLLKDLSALHLGQALPHYPDRLESETLLWLSIKAAKRERLGYSVFHVFYIGRESKHLDVVESFVLKRLAMGDCKKTIELCLEHALERYQSVLVEQVVEEIDQ
ncbi:hypothetical protein GT360_15800 [Vibrio astriarenae]|uniref:Uncharacterized protein n=1 Tax=Vibrio astriarenae TaxID=1481923 RepID=A0A7Z2T683_9VIBR|nr:hypothetical protein [Vibrio astriarenae]QIA65025.1 hypothetical protein GT360_15800 [Vibrio astriarenae]